jgi:uncharacterized protein YheU (UPF0270 family)
MLKWNVPVFCPEYKRIGEKLVLNYSTEQLEEETRQNPAVLVRSILHELIQIMKGRELIMLKFLC